MVLDLASGGNLGGAEVNFGGHYLSGKKRGLPVLRQGKVPHKCGNNKTGQTETLGRLGREGGGSLAPKKEGKDGDSRGGGG